MNEQMKDLLHFYALGVVTEDERLQVERYLVQHPEAQAWLDELQASLLDLPEEAAPVAPSPQVKAQLMARVKADAQKRAAGVAPRPIPAAPRPRGLLERLFDWRLTLTPVMAALGVVVLVAAGLLSLYSYSQATTLRQTVELRDSQIETLQTENQNLLAANAQLNETIQLQEGLLKDKDGQIAFLEQNNEAAAAVLLSPAAQRIELRSASEREVTLGYLIADPESGVAVFIAANLEPLQEPATYQLWLIRGEEYISVGLFAGAGAVHYFEAALPVGDYDLAGVSYEPDGPQETPTQVIMVGAIS